MNLFLYLSNLFILSMNKNQIIKNMYCPSCISCKYFKPCLSDLLLNNTYNTRCTKFGTKNYITGMIDYEYAPIARQNENLCGMEAKYFEKRRIFFD
jgi:hypothetical protein